MEGQKKVIQAENLHKELEKMKAALQYAVESYEKVNCIFEQLLKNDTEMQKRYVKYSAETKEEYKYQESEQQEMQQEELNKNNSVKSR